MIAKNESIIYALNVVNGQLFESSCRTLRFRNSLEEDDERREQLQQVEDLIDEARRILFEIR